LNDILTPLNITLPPELLTYSISSMDPNLIYPK
jgi:hypothetical protein